MAENVTIARPYAEAVFQLAKGFHALESWQGALTRFAAIAEEKQMKEFVSNPRLFPAQITQLFLDIAGKDISAEQQNFINVLVDNERLHVLPEIRDLFAELKNEHEGVKEANIISAFPLDDATLKNLVSQLEARFQYKFQTRVNVDPDLIGGVRIAIGDDVIDASVRGKLSAMATALKN